MRIYCKFPTNLRQSSANMRKCLPILKILGKKSAIALFLPKILRIGKHFRMLAELCRKFVGNLQ